MTRWLPISMLFAALLAPAENVADKLSAAGAAQFNTAYQAWDAKGFAAATELFRQATTNRDASTIHFYWLGVAQFHHMLHLQTPPTSPTNKVAAAAFMEASLDALNRAVKLDGQHAESHALLGTLYGMKIGANLWRAARFGPKVQGHRAKALQSGAKNPRVRYLLGTCQFHTAQKPPALREALASFLAAEKLFDVEAQRSAGPLEPRWGYATCLTFIGRTYEQLGQRAEAADYFRKALARQPSDHLAREGLARVTKSK